jgi:PAS domain S-box-containing protein
VTARFPRVNRRFCEITGYTEAELLERTIVDITHPEDQEQDQLHIMPVLRGERDHWQVEKRYVRPDGEIVWVIVTGSLIRDEAGRPLRTVATIHDITDRKRLEQALQQQAEALRTADQRKDEFLAMLAHELRNPLAAIRNAVTLLQHVGPDEPRFVRAREIIERQVAHQTRLLEDLLDVSRIIRGMVKLRRERVDLTRVVRDAAEDCRSLLEQAQLTLKLELPEEPVWVEGDPTRLAQIVGNLLQNAAKFTDQGGAVGVQVFGYSGVRGRMARPEHLNTRTPEYPNPVVLTIRDTGIGIEPALLSQVFDPFTQGEQTLDRSRGGLGLGLALVRGLVQLHGGEVWAESEGIGHGAAFHIRLPVASAAAEPAAVASLPSPAGPIRVLIVEDNRDAAQSLRDLLELFGCTVEVAHSGPEALASARRCLPEVVLCDLGLPGMDGYQVAAALRQEPLTANARLIAVSGYGQEEAQRRSHEAGFDLHLTKPVDFDELQRLLEVTPQQR